MSSKSMCYTRYDQVLLLVGDGDVALLTLYPDCLQKSNYKEERCQKQVGHRQQSRDPQKTDTNQVDALYECCNAFYQKNGDNASTLSCPKASLLR
jgi:hypothetical protein